MTREDFNLPPKPKGFSRLQEKIVGAVKRVFSRQEYVIIDEGSYRSYSYKRETRKLIDSLAGWTPFKKMTYLRRDQVKDADLEGKNVLYVMKQMQQSSGPLWETANEERQNYIDKGCKSICTTMIWKDAFEAKNLLTHYGRPTLESPDYHPGYFYNRKIARKYPEYKNYFKLVREDFVAGNARTKKLH
jgi:hypothetical protein